MSNLPLEILWEIASTSIESYRNMLNIPLFARSLSPLSITTFKIKFGFTVTIKNGKTMWKLNRKLHRIDGPAVDWDDGTKEWYKNGKVHRKGGPAVEYSCNSKILYQGGVCYNKIYWNSLFWKSTGDKEWYQNGLLHREDGPAIDYVDGTKIWYWNGTIHRSDGPAVIFSNGGEKWINYRILD